MALSHKCRQSVEKGVGDGLVFPKKVLLSAGEDDDLIGAYFLSNLNGKKKTVNFGDKESLQLAVEHLKSTEPRTTEVIPRNYSHGLDFLKWMLTESNKLLQERENQPEWNKQRSKRVIRSFGASLSLGKKTVFIMQLCIMIFVKIQYPCPFSFLLSTAHSKTEKAKSGLEKHAWGLVLVLSPTSDYLQDAALIAFEPNPVEVYGINATEETVHETLFVPTLLGRVGKPKIGCKKDYFSFEKRFSNVNCFSVSAR